MELERRAGSRRALVAVLALLGALAAGMLSLGVAMAAVAPDVKVSDQAYVKANGRAPTRRSRRARRTTASRTSRLLP